MQPNILATHQLLNADSNSVQLDLLSTHQRLNADSNSSNELPTSHFVETGSLSVDIELQHHNLMHSPPLGGSSSSIKSDFDFYASVDQHIFEEFVGTSAPLLLDVKEH